MQHQSEESKKSMLREKAGKLTDNLPAFESESLPPDELKRLLQELQNYRTELEMQNEQLRVTTLELQESQRKYENLYHFAPSGYLTLNDAGLIIDANKIAREMLMPGHLKNKSFIQFVAPEDHLNFLTFFKRVLDSDQNLTTELKLLTRKGQKLYARLDGRWCHEDISGRFCWLAITDITFRKLAEAELLNSENLLQKTQRIARLGSWEFIPQTGEINWSEEVYRIFGYEPGSVNPTTRLMVQRTHPADQEFIANIFSGAGLADQPVTIKRRITDKNGALKYLQTTIFSETDILGNTIKIIGAVQDITKQKNTELELQQKEYFLNHVADASPDVIYVFDLEQFQVIYLNKQIYNMLGFSPEQMKASAANFLADLIHPDDNDIINNGIEILTNAGTDEVLELEYRLRHADGSYRWIRNRLKEFNRNAAGQLSQIIGVCKDVTNRKRTEEELKIKDKIISGMLNNLPVIVSRVDQDGTIQDISGSGLQSLGLVSESLRRTSIFNLFPELAPNFDQIQNEVIIGFESAFPSATGTNYFQSYFFFDPEYKAAIGFSVNISPQKIAQQRAKLEKEFSESLLDNSVDGILAFDKELRITAWNKVLEQRSKVRKSNVLGRKIFDQFPDFKKTEGGNGVLKVLQGERVTLFNQTFGPRAGEFEVYLNPLYNENHEIAGGLAILHDVTVRNRLEAERTSEKLEQEKEILNVVLQTQESERRRIAEILHNSLGQLLYGVKLNFEQFNTYLSLLPADLETTTDNIRSLLNEAIQEVRTISFELMPSILEDFGLANGIEELSRKLSAPKLQFKCFSKGFTKRLSKATEIILYRIIQELINNVIKHSKATEGIIHLARTSKSVLISLEDNGIGFDPNAMLNYKDGIGLKSIRSQLKLIDATMTIESKLGKGTIVTIKLKV